MRECTPSLFRMFIMWVRSVSTLMWSLAAISLLERPSAREFRTSCSRGVICSMLARASSSSSRFWPASRRSSTNSCWEIRGSPSPRRLVASSMSSTSADLCTTPAAPASMALACSALSRLAVRTTAANSGLASRSSTIRSVPSPSGRERSRTPRSAVGESPVTLRASASVPAWATTWKSGCWSKTYASVWRNEAWSSTSKMRCMSSLSRAPVNPCERNIPALATRKLVRSRAGELSGLPTGQGGEAHPEQDPGPRALPALHLEPPAEREDALAHPRQAHPEGGLRLETLAVVLHLHEDLVARRAEGHHRVLGAGVAPHVGQGLLDHAHHLHARGPGEPHREPVVHDQLEFATPADLAVQLDYGGDGADEGPLPGAFEAQIVDGLAQSPHGPLQRLYLSIRLPGGVRALGHPLRDLHGLQGVGQVLQDHVVQLAGYATALGLPDLTQGFLGALALGDVLDGAFVANDLALVVVDGAGVGRDPHRGAILAEQLRLEAVHDTVPHHEPGELPPAFRIHVELFSDAGDGPEQLLGGLVAEHAGHRGVRRHELPFDRGLEDPLDGVLEDGPVLLLGPPALLLGLPPLGDVLVDEHDLLDLAFGILHRVDVSLHPAVGHDAHAGDGGVGLIPDRRHRRGFSCEGLLDVGHYALLDELAVLQDVVSRYLVQRDAPELLPRPVDPQRSAVGGEDLGAKGGLLDHESETRLRGPQRRLGPAPLAAYLGLPELPLDGAVEPGEVVLHEVVVGTSLHGRDGGILADLAAHDDEGQIHEALAPEQPQRRRRAEGRHGVVGDDEVPTCPIEGGLHILRSVYPLPRGVVPALAQHPQEEQGVVLRVLDDEDFEIHAHSSTYFRGLARMRAHASACTWPARSFPHYRLCNSHHIEPLFYCQRGFIATRRWRAKITHLGDTWARLAGLS